MDKLYVVGSNPTPPTNRGIAQSGRAIVAKSNTSCNLVLDLVVDVEYKEIMSCIGVVLTSPKG